MAIAVECSCGKRFEVPDSLSGRTGSCTGCGAPLVVPTLESGHWKATEGVPSPPADAPAGAPPPPPPPPGAGDLPTSPPGQDIAFMPDEAIGGSLDPDSYRVKPQIVVGSTFGGYQLTYRLGDATSGVFMSMSDQGIVALKVLPDQIINISPTAGKRFLREARALFGLDHPNLVHCLDAGEELGTYYLAMEYFEGKTAADLLPDRDGKFPEAEAIEIGLQAAEGLKYLHEKGFVHRDIKPDHVLISGEGHVKLIGFGLVRDEEGTSDLTVKGAIVGTPEYMSPEQAIGDKVDARSDLFALGVTLYEMVTGHLPFDKDVSHFMQKAAPAREKNPRLSPPGSAVIDMLIQTKPEDRYASASELISDFKAVAAGLKTGVPQRIKAMQVAEKANEDLVKKLTAALVVVGGLVVILIVTLLVVFASS